MTNRRLTQERLDAHLGDLAGLIEKHGLAIQGVFGKELGEDFSYTVGRTESGKPELWLAALDPRQATPILNYLARLDPAAGTEVPAAAEDATDGFSVPFRVIGPVDLEAAQVGAARRMYGFEPEAVSVLQVLWPDDAGHFPGEDGYDAERFPQTVLPLAGA